MGSKDFVLTFCLLLLVASFVSAVDTSRFEYISTVKVNCEEYKGYARFELPSEFNSISSPATYMNIDYSVSGEESSFFRKVDNWYINNIDGYSIEDVEKIFDMNYNSYLLSDGASKLEFVFENPSARAVDKISIDVRDSVIGSVVLYDGQGKKIDFSMAKNTFHYELIFKNKIVLDNVRFVLGYSDVLKLKEVAFYEEESGADRSYVYFYVDNNCKNDSLFYFGNYGDSNLRRGAKSLPVEFDVEVGTMRNSDYVKDFDFDGLLNGADNCLDVSNADQKDINYNGIGDACEDDDGDGIANSLDNCVDNYNRDQADNDEDGIGNVCDEGDDRFFEKNKYLVYIGAGIIAVLFVVFAIVVMKKE